MSAVPVPRNVLVTVFGGTGFVGRHTVRALARAGYRVRVAARYPHEGFFLASMGQVGQIVTVKCNVDDPDQVASAVSGASAVINLTGINYERGEQTFEAVHVQGARTIAQAAKAAGAKAMVHVSAIGADRNADSAYSASKGEGELAVREEFAEAAILRPSLVFGPEDDFFNRFAAMSRMLPFLPLVGGGKTRFQPVFVGDLADAVIRCVEDQATRGRTFEIGGPVVYTFKELMEVVKRETARSPVLIPVPYFVASVQAMFLQFAPKPMLTPEQVTRLKTDNVVTGSDTLASLSISPTSVEAEVPSYLWRYRPKGQYDESVRDKLTEMRSAP
jgi:NADH dehydrogenase